MLFTQLVYCNSESFLNIWLRSSNGVYYGKIERREICTFVNWLNTNIDIQHQNVDWHGIIAGPVSCQSLFCHLSESNWAVTWPSVSHCHKHNLTPGSNKTRGKIMQQYDTINVNPKIVSKFFIKCLLFLYLLSQRFDRPCVKIIVSYLTHGEGEYYGFIMNILWFYVIIQQCKIE